MVARDRDLGNSVAEGDHVPTSPHHLLLTGVPGVGKTTVIRRVADGLPGMPLGGFYTGEIRQSGVRQGFRLRSFDGRERLIAHVGLPKRYRVGKYGVDVATIDTAAEELLIPAPGLAIYLVDEIGKMECLSARFIGTMQRLLHSDKTVIATVGKKGGSAAIACCGRSPPITARRCRSGCWIG
jgi:nucleoside-triphosphatase